MKRLNQSSLAILLPLHRIIFFMIMGLSFGCGGTHGKIESFDFDCEIDDLIVSVDRFLLNDKDLTSRVNPVNGWIYSQELKSGNKFTFSIGGFSQITLIAAGAKNSKAKLDKDLWFFEKEKLIKSFSEEVISNIEIIKYDTSFVILREPFKLAINSGIDTVWRPSYVLKYDTLVSYPLPEIIKEKGVEWFKVLIQEYFHSQHDKLSLIHQYKNYFRFSDDITGYLEADKIVINGYYRVVGEKKQYQSIFEQPEWQKYVDTVQVGVLEKNVESIIAEGYQSPIKYVTSKMAKEYWMVPLLKQQEAY